MVVICLINPIQHKSQSVLNMVRYPFSPWGNLSHYVQYPDSVKSQDCLMTAANLERLSPWLSSLRLTSTKTIKMSIGVGGLGKQACYFLLSFLFLLFSRPTLSLWRKEEQLNISNKALVLHPLPSTLVVEIQVMISTLLIGDDLTELFFDNSLWKNGEWVHGSNEPTCLWCSTRPRAWRRLWSLFPFDRHRWPIFASFYWPFQEHCGQGDKSLVITFPCNWLRHRVNWATEALSKETRYVSP